MAIGSTKLAFDVETCASAAFCASGLPGGACKAPACVAGQKDCQGADLRKCNADQTAFDIETCATSALCADGLSLGACATPACAVGQKDCQGADLRKCNAGRTAFDVDTCDSAALCTAGLPGGACSCTGGAGPPMVRVPGACIDSTEVTNAHYAAFLATGPSALGQDAWCSWNTDFTPYSDWPATGQDTYPVAHVDWCDAFAYCKWAGKRLCGKIGGGANAFGDYSDATRSQWYAACSAGGTLTYPYGSAYDPLACNGDAYGAGATIPVGSATGCEGGYPGVYDLSGNVFEWEDSCDGQTEGAGCRARGGSFTSTGSGAACDYGGSFSRDLQYFLSFGFRCCGP